MMHTILTAFTQQLNEYLKIRFSISGEIAYLSPVKDEANVFPKNRVSISLLNIETENAAGMVFNKVNTGGSRVTKSAPSRLFNLIVLIAVIFREKQYPESIQVVSGILSFLQSHTILQVPGPTNHFVVDPVGLSIRELTNLWNICGTSYYPSFLCKIRTVTIDEKEIKDLSFITENQDVKTTPGKI